MANQDEELISKYIDEVAIERQTQFFLGSLKKLSDAYDAVNAKTINLDAASGSKGTSAAIKELRAVVDDLTKSREQLLKTDLPMAQAIQAETRARKESKEATNQQTRSINEYSNAQRSASSSTRQSKEDSDALTKAKKALAFAQSEQNVQLQGYKIQSAEATKAAKAEALEGLGLTDAYKKLTLQYDAAQRNAKNLAAEFGVNSVQAKAAAAEALLLNKQLQTIDKTVGQSQKNVGNYTASFKSAFSVVRQLAYALPGIGISGIFLLLGKAIADFAIWIREATTSINPFSEKIKLLGEINAKAAESSSKQISTIKQLTTVLNDGNVSLDGKKKALTDLIALDPKYLNGLTLANVATAEGKKILDAYVDVLRKKAEVESAASVSADAQKQVSNLEVIKATLQERLKAVKTNFNDLSEEELKFLSRTKTSAGRTAFTSSLFNSEVSKSDIRVMISGVEEEIKRGETKVTTALGIFSKKTADLSKTALDVKPGIVESLKKQIGEIDKEINTETVETKLRALVKTREDLQKRLDDLTKIPKEKKQRTPADLTNETLAAGERLRKANAELQKQQIDQDAKYQQEIIDNDKASLAERLQAVDDYNSDRVALITIGTNLEVQAIDAQLAQIELIEQKRASKRTTEEKKLLLNKDALVAERTAIETAATAKETDVIRDGVKKKLDLIKEGLSEEDKIRMKALDKRLADIDIEEQKELVALGRSFREGTISVTDYETKKTAISDRYELIRLVQAQKNAKDLLIAAVQDEKASEELEKKFTDAAAKLDDYLTGKKIANQKKLKEVRDTFTQEAKDSIIQFVDFQFEKEKNAVQGQIDTLEAKKNKDIEVVNASLASNQEKADQITIIEATAQAQRDQLAARQREIDARQAKTDKAVGVLKISAETAATVVKLSAAAAAAKAEAALLFANPLTAAYAPIALASAGAILAQIPFVIGTGAIQAALIAAKPIPAYKYGTKDQTHPGGPAITGDGGRSEYVLLPDGSGFRTPATSTVYDLPEGTKVMPDADVFLNRAFYHAINTKVSGLPAAPISDSGKTMTGVISRKLDRLNDTVKNKRETHINGTHGGVTMILKSGGNWLTYVDQNVHFIN